MVRRPSIFTSSGVWQKRITRGKYKSQRVFYSDPFHCGCVLSLAPAQRRHTRTYRTEADEKRSRITRFELPCARTEGHTTSRRCRHGLKPKAAHTQETTPRSSPCNEWLAPLLRFGSACFETYARQTTRTSIPKLLGDTPWQDQGRSC